MNPFTFLRKHGASVLLCSLLVASGASAQRKNVAPATVTDNGPGPGPPPSSTVALSAPSLTDTAPPPPPSFNVRVSRNKVPVGNAMEIGGGLTGKNTLKNIANALIAQCPQPSNGPSGGCISSTAAHVNGLYDVTDGAEVGMSLAFTVEDSNFTDYENLETMVGIWASTFVAAAVKSCGPFPHINGRDSGCDPSDSVKRDTVGPYPCKEGGTACSGPNLITVDDGKYNYLQIEVEEELQETGTGSDIAFACDVLAPLLEAAVVAFFPELDALVIPASITLEMLCEDKASNIKTGNPTKRSLDSRSHHFRLDAS